MKCYDLCAAVVECAICIVVDEPSLLYCLHTTMKLRKIFNRDSVVDSILINIFCCPQDEEWTSIVLFYQKIYQANIHPNHRYFSPFDLSICCFFIVFITCDVMTKICFSYLPTTYVTLRVFFKKKPPNTLRHWHHFDLDNLFRLDSHEPENYTNFVIDIVRLYRRFSEKLDK